MWWNGNNLYIQMKGACIQGLNVLFFPLFCMFHNFQTSNMGSSPKQIKNNTSFKFKGWFNIK